MYDRVWECMGMGGYMSVWEDMGGYGRVWYGMGGYGKLKYFLKKNQKYTCFYIIYIIVPTSKCCVVCVRTYFVFKTQDNN